MKRPISAATMLWMAIAAAPPAQAVPYWYECQEGYGDVGMSGAVDVTDVLCLAEVALLAMNAPDAPPKPPLCALAGLQAFDLDCNGWPTMLDAQVAIALALELPFPSAIDADSNGCVDACDASCGDGLCGPVYGETCQTCPTDCGACESPCCDSHDGVGCESLAVTSCVCSISPFCCSTLWDQTCADLAVDFCGADCEVIPCAVTSTVGCGESILMSNEGSLASFESFGCDSALADGAERIFRFEAPYTTGVELTLWSASKTNHTVRVLPGSCEPTDCLGFGSVSTSLAVYEGDVRYLVVDGPVAGEGLFQLHISCGEACDVPALCADAECGKVKCGGETFSCGTCPSDQLCAAGVCEEVDVAGCPGSGSCLQPNPSLGCSDTTCCAAVCEIDSFCCIASWDGYCAALAQSVCEL